MYTYNEESVLEKGGYPLAVGTVRDKQTWHPRYFINLSHVARDRPAHPHTTYNKHLERGQISARQT
jgi:hypothetical protein